ncbi:MAG: hypothetical protein CVT93_00480 [Bacteroidetes bacterium HGW-Bacteroidetes-10]|nr:MAG: hypothetical protein CVT93_00480 [Bacteroidetes bacterium HGW-Bacteroidetes-10]
MQKTRLPYILVYLLTAVIVSQSCANTTAPPSGGLKDTLAPVLVKVSPDSNSVNFPREKGKIELRFNEYTVLKEPEKHIVVSPPQKRRAETKVRGKSIIVEFKETLEEARTYSVSFGNSIVDNNEGNIFPQYRYTFSTGETIDSMLATGSIVDAKTLLPIPGATIAFYENHADSALYSLLPSAVAKSDKWGYFLLTNIKPVEYRVIAFVDGNSNNIYNPENEKLAFLDTLYRPGIVMKKDMEQLKYVDPMDTTASLARSTEIQLYLFREEAGKQMIRTYERPLDRMSFIKFNVPYVQIDSVGFENIDSSFVIKQFNIKRDSLVLWLGDSIKRVPDTLFLNIKYMKSDSLDNLVSTRERLKLTAPRKKREENQPSRNTDIRADLMKMKVEANPALLEKDGYVLDFPAPLSEIKFEEIKFKSVTPKGVEASEEFSLERDSVELRKYYIKPKSKLLTGHDYVLTLNQAAFKDIYGHTNDTIISKSMLPKNERLAKIDVTVKGTKGATYVIELTNQSRERVYRSYKVMYDSELAFPYLEQGKYSIRIFRDENSNGILDSGNLKERRQPEMVRLYLLPSGSSVIELKEGMELSQNINLEEIFK